MNGRPLPPIHRLTPRLYYGWVVAVACGVVSFVTVGIGFYGMSVLLEGFTSTRGFSKAQVAGPTSLYFITTGLAGIWIGRFVDRRGARGVMVLGSLLLAVTLLAVGRVSRPEALWVLYPLMALGFSLCGGVPTNAIVTRWFVGLRARAMSFSHSGVSVGGIVLVPLATWLVHAHGLPAATGVLAVLLLAVALPVTLGVLRFDPREHGLVPDGREDARRDNPLLAEAHQVRRWRSRELLRTPSFWLMAAAFGIILFCQQSVLVHQVALLQERTGSAQAGAYAVSVTAGASIVARLVVGSFADRVEKKRLALALMGVQSGALVGFALAPNLPALYAAAIVFGFTIGNIFMLQSLLVGELFGLASFGTVFGLLGLVSQVLGGFGPGALGLLHARFGAYEPGVLVMAGLAVVSAGVLSQVRPPRPRPEASAPTGA